MKYFFGAATKAATGVHRTAKLNRQRWVSNRIAQLARWVDVLLRKIWTSDNSQRIWLVSLVRLPLRSRPLLCGLLSEVHSFFGRIEMLCKEELWHRGLVVGPALEVSQQGVVQACSETERRTESTRNLRLEFPWVSQTDLALFLRGFDAAVATLPRNSDTQNEFEFRSLRREAITQLRIVQVKPVREPAVMF